MIPLTLQSIDVLTAAGWSPGTLLSTDAYAATLIEKGFTPFYSAIEFVREFGGIKFAINESVPIWYMNHTEFLQDASCLSGPRYIAEYERSLARKLLPIGFTDNGHYKLLIDEGGAVYGGGDGVFVSIGSDRYDAINAICECRKFKQIPLIEQEAFVFSGPVPLEFSPATSACLEQSGWHPGRRVNCLNEFAELTAAGYSLSIIQRSFIQEFGNLEIGTVDGSEPFTIVFCPAEASRRLSLGRVAKWREHTRESRLAPVGVVQDPLLIVMLGGDGALYLMMPELDDWITRFGRNVAESLNTYCLKLQAEVVR